MRYLLLLLLASCTTLPVEAPKEEKPAEVTAPVEGWRVASPKFIWTKYLVEALDKYGNDLLAAQPEDMADYCPNYSSLDRNGRMQMWVMLLTKLVQYESNYKPATTFYEKNVPGNPTSRGLFQMSILSSKNYFCGIQKEMDLHDPKTNIECTVKAFNILVPKGNKYGSPSKGSRLRSMIGGPNRYETYTDSKGVKRKRYLGAGAYWSPFRVSDRSSAIKAAAKSVCAK